MRGKDQRIVVAFIGGPFFALGDEGGVRFQAEVVLFDFVRVVQESGAETAGERRFADAFGTGEQQVWVMRSPRIICSRVSTTSALPWKFSKYLS